MARHADDKIKKDWAVEVSVTVVKVIHCFGCTKAQAESDPFKYRSYVEEVDQKDDMKILRIEELT